MEESKHVKIRDSILNNLDLVFKRKPFSLLIEHASCDDINDVCNELSRKLGINLECNYDEKNPLIIMRYAHTESEPIIEQYQLDRHKVYFQTDSLPVVKTPKAQ